VTEREIFIAALQHTDPDGRQRFIRFACGGDLAMEGRIERLFAHYEQVGNFLNVPAAIDHSPAEPRLAPSDRSAVVDQTWIGPSTLVAGVMIAERYKLLQEIGTGGMGAVWMAEQVTPVKRFVALKVIREGLDSRRVLARFEAERQALALMDHPHIARILDAGTTATGRPFFVMELVKGQPITEFCDNHQLTVVERLKLFVEVCHAIQHAHQKGIIHRDLKPSNILIESHDGKPVPKIIDFGLAKALHHVSLTQQTLFTGFGEVLGTPLYMSPEQAELSALDVDTRSDIYALGVILYELLTGGTPLERNRVARAAWDEVRRVIREEEPQRPSTRLSSLEALPSVAARRQIEPSRLARLIRGDLDWIVMRALAKERDRRYATASAFAEDVGHFLCDEPVSAGPPTVLYRLRKFAKRHRGRVITAALLLIVCVLGMVGTLVGLVRARKAEFDLGQAFGRVTKEQEKTSEALLSAEQNRVEAETQRDRARERLSRQYVEKAVELANTGNPVGGMPWLVEALKLNESQSDQNRMQRMRIGSLLQSLPRLVNFWPDAVHARLHPDGQKIGIAQGTSVNLLRIGSDQPLIPSLAHTSPVSQIHFTPFGDRLVVVCNRTNGGMGNPASARIWDATNGQPLTAEVPIGNHERGATETKISPDGSHLIAIWQGHLNRHNVNTEVSIYHLATMKQVGSAFVHGHEEDFDRVRIDLKNLRALTLTRNTPPNSLEFLNEAQVWDLRTGMALFDPIRLPAGISDGCFDPSGQRIALAGSGVPVTVHDARSGDNLLEIPHDGGATNVVFHPDGSLIASMGADNNLHVFDASTGAESISVSGQREGEGWYRLEFTPEGDSLFARGSFGQALIDVKTGESQLSISDNARDSFRTIAFDTEGVHAATAGYSEVRLWRREGGVAECTLPHGGMVDPSFSRDGRFLITAGNGVRVWDLAGRRPKSHSLGEPAADEMRSQRLDPEGRRVACLDAQGRMQIRNALTGALEVPPTPLPGDWRAIGISRDGRYAVTIGWSEGESTIPTQEELDGRMCSGGSGSYLWESPRTLQVWDTMTGQAVSGPLPYRSVYAIHFHPDGKSLYVVGSYFDYSNIPAGAFHEGKRRFELSMVDLPNGQLKMPVRQIPGRVDIVAFTNDGSRLLVLKDRHDGQHRAAQVWDSATLQPVGPLLGTDEDWIARAEFRPGHDQVLTVSEKGIAQVWDAAKGTPIGASFKHLSTHLGQSETIGAASFSTDGKQIVTATGTNYTSTGEARVWDFESGRPLTPLLRHSNWVRNASFSPDRKVLVTASASDQRGWEVRLWEIATGLAISPPIPISTSWSAFDLVQSYEQIRVTDHGTRLLIPSDEMVEIVQIEIDDCPAADLEHLAKVLAGYEIDATGGPQPISQKSATEAWRNWATNHPAGRQPLDANLRDCRERTLRRVAKAKQWDATRRVADTLLTQSPHEAWLWHQKALAAKHLSRWDEAESAFRELLRLEQNPTTLFQFGEVLVAQHKLTDAIGMFERAWLTGRKIEHGIALACAQWAAGDRDAYQTTCIALLSREAEFAGFSQRLVAVSLTRTAFDKNSDGDEQVRNHLKSLFTVEETRNHLAAALALQYVRIGEIQKADGVLPDAPRFDLTSRLVRTLILLRSNQAVLAKKQLAECRNQWSDESASLNWPQRLWLQALLKEIENESPPTNELQEDTK